MKITRRTALKAAAVGAGFALVGIEIRQAPAAVASSGAEALTVNIDPDVAVPVPPNFGGYNPDFQVVGMNFLDPQAAALARELRAGTLRFPSGTDSDYFDLRGGDVRPEWAAQFFGKMTAFDTASDDAQVIGAKPQRHRLDDFRTLLDDIAADTVIIINGFTDTPESAGAIAAYCVANSIRVSAFELSNEGWLLPKFFMDATDYAARMKPYFEAIKEADPGAQVNVMFSQGEAPAWDQALADYPDKYWDGISFHMYGGGDRYSTFDDAVKDLNTRLADRTNSYIDSYYLAKGRPDMRVTVSEFNSTPSTMTTLSTSGIIRTLYNGIFAAEFITRLSAHPNVDRVMLHGLVQFGTTFSKPYLDTMKNVHERGETLDTAGFDYGIVRHGSALALSVCLDAIHRSSHTLGTTSDGALTVPKYGGTVPAVHAQAYAGQDGYDSLVLTNKSAVEHTVAVQWQGAPVAGPFDVRWIASEDPRAENTAAVPDTVVVQESAAAGTVVMPAYSVMRVRWARAPRSLPASLLTYGAVSDLAVKAGRGRLEVSWQKGLGAEKHRVVCRAANGSVAGDKVTKKSDLVFMGLANGIAYSVTVAPIVGGVAGAESQPVLVQLGSPPAPVLDTASPSDRAVNLGWSPVVGADGYLVRYGPTGTEHSLDVGNAIGARIALADNDAPFVFVVFAVNSFGESAASNSLTATPSAGLPYAPHSVLAAAGAGGTAVWWKPSYKRLVASDLEGGTDDLTLTGAWTVQSLPGADGPLTAGLGMSNRLGINGSGTALIGPAVAANHFVGAEMAFAEPLGGSAGLLLRYLDADNYLFAVFDFATARHSIGRVSAGVHSTLAETPVITDQYAMPKAGRQMTYRFELEGTSLALFRDGSEVLRTSAADLAAGEPGRSGVIASGSAVNFDRIHVDMDTATGFDVLRAPAAGGPYSLIVSDHPSSTFLDTGASGADDYYRVVSVADGLRSADASHPAPARLKNVARDATIVASSTLAGTATAKLVDGIRNQDSSRWVSQPGEPHDLEFSWSTPRTVGRVCVYTGFMANRGFQVAAFDVQNWVDGAWQTIATVVGNDRDVFDGTFNDLSFVPVTTRRLRLHITDACTAPTYTNARVLEVEIYGK